MLFVPGDYDLTAAERDGASHAEAQRRGRGEPAPYCTVMVPVEVKQLLVSVASGITSRESAQAWTT